jgi:PAS domain S-box-containing protein
MGWLTAGVLYSLGYAAVGQLLQDSPTYLSWFRAAALCILPLTSAVMIFRGRSRWRGCQWLYWSTLALGLVMSALGLTGWAVHEIVTRRETWLAWPAVFTLFGGIAPLFALLAQPHRGAREPLAATTAVDIAGLAVVTGFLYSFFVTTQVSDLSLFGQGTGSLLFVSQIQQTLVAAGMTVATLLARETAWRATYRRVACGGVVALAMLTLSNVEVARGLYRSAFVYDFTWILPFAFYPWAASKSPTSDDHEPVTDSREEHTRPRPWVIFAAVALIPFIDFGLRMARPDMAGGPRDVATAVTLISVLPLLVARIAAERAELQQADGTTRLLTQIIEQTQDLILVTMPDGSVRHANQSFCRAVGISREELTTLKSRDVTAAEFVSPEERERLVHSGGTWRGTVTRTRRDGTTFPVSATLAALVDARGATSHLVSVERDISEERRLREQLIHSERLSAVGQLVAGVAHELNNPLQTVLGMTELLIASERRADVREDLERIRTGAHRAAKIVMNLLAFARHSTLERTVEELNDIVRSTLVLRAVDLRVAKVKVVEEYTSDLPLILANREEIRQIVLNLLVNAEHAVQGRGPAAVIRVKTGVAERNVFVEVEDNGPGISSELAGRIFEPFFTTKPVNQGTGLGLSVSLGIAEAHGGSLRLASSERGGACFVLTLPRAEDRRAMPATAAPVAVSL